MSDDEDPFTITTAEQLDALADETIVITRSRMAFQKDDSGDSDWWLGIGLNNWSAVDLAERHNGFRIIYDPTSDA